MDWKNLVMETLSTGMGKSELSRESGLSVPAVYDLLSGSTKSVKWEVGQKLIRIHRRAMKKVFKKVRVPNSDRRASHQKASV